MENNNLFELIINYKAFKQDLQDLMINTNKKVYLINKKDLDQFLEIYKNYENKSINDLKKELSNKNMNVNISNKNIKLISKFSEIEDTELELVDKKFVSYLDYNEEYIKSKELILIKRSENIKEIIFRKNEILKIKNKSIFQFTESPLVELDDSLNDKKKCIKNYNDKQENKNLNNIHIKSDFKLKNNEIYNVKFKRNSIRKNHQNINSNNINANTDKINSEEIIEYYKNLNKILNKQKEITKSIKDSSNYKNQTYFILNKKYFHKLIKIFESDDIYENDNLILEFKGITDPSKQEQTKLMEINEKYTKRILDLQKEKSFPVEFVEIDEYKYPKDFIIIEDFYLEFLSNDIRNKYKYEMILGNNLLFIKDNVNNKIIYMRRYLFLN